MGFKFNLEPVLKHRKRLEEAAQREFAEAQAAVNAALSELESMYRRCDEVRAEIAEAQREGSPAKIEEARTMEGFIKGQQVRIEAKRLEARRLLEAAEEKQEALIRAAQDRKVLDKLKERRLQQHREWLNQMETKAADDMTTVRSAWGKR